MPYSSWLKHIWVFCWIFSPDGCLPCNCSAAHSAQWQVLELILFAGFLQRSNSRQSCVCVSETSGNINACVSETLRNCTFPCTKRREQSSTECVFKCFSDTHKAHKQPLSISDKHKTLCALHINKKTVFSVLFVHRNGTGNTHACLRQGWFLFYFNEPRL